MHSNIAYGILVIFPVLLSAQPCPLSTLESNDSLDVFLSGAVIGSFVHASMYDKASATLRNEIYLVISEPGGKIAAAANNLSLHELRQYNDRGFLIKASQEVKSASGLSQWKLTKGADSWTYTATIGGVSSVNTVPPVSENISSSCTLLSGIRARTLRPGQAWYDTAFELMSRQTIISKISCVRVDSVLGVWHMETVDDITGRAEKQLLDKNGEIIEQSIEGIYTAKTRKRGAPVTHPASAGDTPSASLITSLSDMFSVAVRRGPSIERPPTAVLADTSMTIDNSVSDCYSRRANRWTLKPQPVSCPAPSRTTSVCAQNPWLAPSPAIQSGHPDIVAAANRICTGISDVCQRIAACNSYVFMSLVKRPTATFSNALETLKAGYGDCGEHATLLAALLRAEGIPARVVLGLLYVEQKKAYFYHAQVQAFAGEWIFADPAWGVFPAYGRFVPLIVDDTGSKAIFIARLIGKIAIE